MAQPFLLRWLQFARCGGNVKGVAVPAGNSGNVALLCAPVWHSCYTLAFCLWKPYIGAGTSMRDMVQRHAWEHTRLGPVAEWPASLRTAAGLVMHSVHPMFLWWGEQLVQIYNDAYLPCFGEGK